MSARSVWSVWARLEVLAYCLIALFILLATGCGQKGPLIAVKPAIAPASSPPSRAPLPPPEPLEPPIPGTAPR